MPILFSKKSENSFCFLDFINLFSAILIFVGGGFLTAGMNFILLGSVLAIIVISLILVISLYYSFRNLYWFYREMRGKNQDYMLLYEILNDLLLEETTGAVSETISYGWCQLKKFPFKL